MPVVGHRTALTDWAFKCSFTFQLTLQVLVYNLNVIDYCENAQISTVDVSL